MSPCIWIITFAQSGRYFLVINIRQINLHACTEMQNLFQGYTNLSANGTALPSYPYCSDLIRKPLYRGQLFYTISLFFRKSINCYRVHMSVTLLTCFRKIPVWNTDYADLGFVFCFWYFPQPHPHRLKFIIYYLSNIRRSII